MQKLITLAALALSGCAPSLMLSNELGGTISQAGTLGNDRAFILAKTHCAKFGKIPIVVNKEVWIKSMRFECIAK